MISKKGEIIVIASVVMDEIDLDLTIFEGDTQSTAIKDPSNEKKKFGATKDQHAKLTDRKNQKARPKLLGLYQLEQCKVILIPCKTLQDQQEFANSSKEYHQKMMETAKRASQDGFEDDTVKFSQAMKYRSDKRG